MTEETEQTPTVKKKKKGSARSIETLFRSAYRTQLDLTSIADAKANMMISVNGLMITGIIATTGLFSSLGGWFKYLPLLILLNSAASMAFAVLAAKPKYTQSRASEADVKSGKASLLYFANFRAISEQDYVKSVSNLIEDVEDVYATMSKHIYNLGYVLTYKYYYLKLAYSIFLYGLIVICALFTLLFLNQTSSSANELNIIETNPFSSIYEPSGIVNVGNNEFLIVEDEPENPFHLVALSPEGNLVEKGIVKSTGSSVYLNDLEGVTFDGQYIYATTSHSQTKNGNAGNGRMVVIRYEYLDGMLSNPITVVDLKEYIVKRLLPSFPDSGTLDIWETVNIEALAWSPQNNSLNFAFRSPLKSGESLVVSINNPNDIFNQSSAKNANIAINWLDFGNNGLRSMSWDATLNGFFMVSTENQTTFDGYSLWKWSGLYNAQPIKISSETHIPKRTEGLSTFNLNNTQGMLAVIDDGDSSLERPGHYKLLSMSVNHQDSLIDTER